MLYQMSKEQIDKAVFQNPPACYRGAPFWSWNCRITKQMIDEQLAYFKEMGMGGVHVHVRVGLRNQYMDDEFLELVRYCNDKAKEMGLLCWLYDEDRYASGIAGGEVTKNVKYRARKLRLTRVRREGALEDYQEFVRLQDRNEKVPECLLKVYDLIQRDGNIVTSRVADSGDDNVNAMESGQRWFLYEELEQETPWCNNQTYVDTLNEEATKCFIGHTHEKYATVLQEEFGQNIPAIFTDEPHFVGLRMPEYACAQEDVLLPFTDKMPQKYTDVCGMDFYESIPYIIWNRAEKEISKERYYFFETCCQLFTESYCKPIKDWCDGHGLLSTGHILGEETLVGQTCNVGDAMRCYTEFQLPGIDNLCDFREFSAVKQASGVAHQMNREGVVSELYGVTQWDFNFEGYKLAGDWQAALGITTRVPHLSWASMGGEAKRDYPAAIGWQSPWYKEYDCIENHFARVNYCMTKGKPDVQIAVIHPIESMWILQGPADRLGDKREELERTFQNVTEWLLTGGLDFDYISEGVLEKLEQEGTVDADAAMNVTATDSDVKKFSCGGMKYDVVVIPACITLRKNTMERLQAFAQAGGSIIFYGENAGYEINDSKICKAEDIKKIAKCVTGKENLLDALEPWRQIDIRGNDGKRRNIYLHQLRQEGECKWLFLAQAFKGMQSRERNTWNRRGLHEAEEIRLRVKGHWQIEKYDTVSGKIESLETTIDGKDTVVNVRLYGDDSLLLHLLPVAGEHAKEILMKADEDKVNAKVRIQEPVSYELSEPNALLLDKFCFSLDGGEENDEEEILKIDNRIRKQLGYPLRMESVEQPYVRKDNAREHKVRLRVVFESMVEIAGCKLAMEEREFSKVFFNGEQIDMSSDGYYVDKAIETIALPVIKKGQNELVVELLYGRGANLEWMYILGDFGVNVYGSRKIIVEKPVTVLWGDYTRQGFPFYTGNMTYYVKVKREDNQKLRLRIPYFVGAAVKVEYADKEKIVAYLPYDCELEDMPVGENMLRLTCLGNRYNGFGQLHMIGNDLTWVGPDSWRTEGESWTDTYRLKEMGILSEPLVFAFCRN